MFLAILFICVNNVLFVCVGEGNAVVAVVHLIRVFNDVHVLCDIAYQCNKSANSSSIMPSRVFVGNIPHSSRERDLERFFKGYGRINEVVIKSGYGFVEFDDSR